MLLNKPRFLPCRRPDGSIEMIDGLPAICLSEDMVFLDTDGTEIIVPVDFRGNGGSVPSTVRWFIHPHDEAAVHAFHLHDYNYTAKRKSRFNADRILFYALRCSGISIPRSVAVWAAVRICGARNWRNAGK